VGKCKIIGPNTLAWIPTLGVPRCLRYLETFGELISKATTFFFESKSNQSSKIKVETK
jgi:hypothetical protein